MWIVGSAAFVTVEIHLFKAGKSKNLTALNKPNDKIESSKNMESYT